MENKVVYHVDRRGIFDKLVQGDRIQACSVKNPFYSNILTGDKVSIHGNDYLNYTGIGSNDQKLSINAIWEVFAEMIRLKAFPQNGSRYSAMFGFENPEDLKAFIKNQEVSQSSNWKVYVLEVSDYLQRDMSQLEISSANESVIEGNPNTYFDNLLIKHCYDYWAGITTTKPVIETLIYGEAIVREVLELRGFIYETKKLI